jgi:hypothetical protein
MNDNFMDGLLPSSIGHLVLLEELYLGYEKGTNKFIGPLPDSMRNLFLLEELFLNVATLTGPLPDLSRLTSLNLCSFIPSQLCRDPQSIPKNSRCNFLVLPVCKDLIPDCVILAEWLPKLFDEYTCCQIDGVTCVEDRIVILDLSKAKAGTFLYGGIPTKIGEWDQLQELYLQDNLLEGTLPISIFNISSLQTVNITNNYLSGVLPFYPQFDLIGIETNFGLSLPGNLTLSESPTKGTKVSQETSANGSTSTPNTIVGLIGASVFLVTAIAFATGVYLYLRRAKRRREDTSYTPSDDWSDGIPMSSVSGSGMYFTDDEIPKDANGLVFKCLISTGGFGQVWKVFKLV